MIVQFVDFVLGCVYLNGELKMYNHARLPTLRARIITYAGRSGLGKSLDTRLRHGRGYLSVISECI